MWRAPRTWVVSETVSAQMMNEQVRDQFNQIGTSARVTHSAAQNVGDLTQTALAFNTEHFDTGGYHDNATNNSRLTIPSTQADGWYAVGGHIFMDAPTTHLWVAVSKNSIFQAVHSADETWWLSVFCVTFGRWAISDFYQLVVSHNDGVTRQVVKATYYSPEFWIASLGDNLGFG